MTRTPGELNNVEHFARSLDTTRFIPWPGKCQWLNRRCAALALMLMMLMPGSGLAGSPAQVSLKPISWVSEHLRDHPLVGTLWHGATGKKASWRDLQRSLRRARFVLIGEIHSNPDHHRWQAAVIDFLGNAGRSPGIVWEMIPTSRQALLDGWTKNNAGGSDDLAQLGEALDWANSGWPPWALYQGIADVARRYRLPMYGAAFEKPQIRQIGRQGMKAYSALQKTRLGLDQPLSQKLRLAMLRELRTAHCNLMPVEALQPMFEVQRARDGQMAAIMQQLADGDGAVLIAGNGHVRKDWAVPAVLRSKRVADPVLSIGQIEVQADRIRATDYAEIGAMPPRHDYVLFTPQADTTDHCARLRQRMQRRTQ